VFRILFAVLVQRFQQVMAIAPCLSAGAARPLIARHKLLSVGCASRYTGLSMFKKPFFENELSVSYANIFLLIRSHEHLLNTAELFQGLTSTRSYHPFYQSPQIEVACENSTYRSWQNCEFQVVLNIVLLICTGIQARGVKTVESFPT
jgi:hypothetical protein